MGRGAPPTGGVPPPPARWRPRQAKLDFHRMAAHARLRPQHPPDAKDEGLADAFDFPGFVPAYIRPLFCRGIGPFRWAALSGDPRTSRAPTPRCAS
jgi:hypothetical protein